MAIVLNYFDVLMADQRLILNFRKEYSEYIEEVPRLNFIAGIISLIKRIR